MAIDIVHDLGINVRLSELNPYEVVDCAVKADKLGYGSSWVTEESSRESFSVQALIADRTKSIDIGSGIINIFSRTPTLIAMGVATIDEISKGRAFLGIGTGGIGFVERGHGVKFLDVLTRMREYLMIIRDLLNGKRITYQGKYFNLTEFKLKQTLYRQNPPIYVAALNPKMTQLAGEIADGVIANMLPISGIRELRENLKIGAERAGKSLSGFRMATLAMTCGETSDSLEVLRKAVAFYSAAPTYLHILERAGFGDVAKSIAKAWYKNEHEKATSLVTDSLLETIAVVGSPSQRANRIREYISNGVIPIVYPISRSGHETEDVVYAMRAAVNALS
jgi:5,10-methylenetetrahydromethanopterin reductase